jgi:membrane protein DedA with SNARE-associated domain
MGSDIIATRVTLSRAELRSPVGAVVDRGAAVRPPREALERGRGDAVASSVSRGVADAEATGEATTRSELGSGSRPQAARSITSANREPRALRISPTVRQDAAVTEHVEAPDAPPARTHRVPDGVAFGLLGAYLISRQFTQRIGLGLVAKISLGWAWVIPLLNNSSLALLVVGIRATGEPSALVPIAIASVVFSTVVGLIMYWAGWRFGHRLAESAKQPGSPWAGVWNPKQIARAERWMESKGIVVVFLARATEFFTLPVNLVAGASEMSIRKWLAAHTAGAAAFAALMLWLASLAKERWPWLPDWVEDVFAPWALRISLGLVVLLVIAMMLGRSVKPKDKAQDGETTTPSQPPSESPSAD